MFFNFGAQTQPKPFVIFNFLGPRGDHVSAVQLEGRPVEFGHHRLSVFDRQGSVSGSDPSGPQTLLREKRKSFTKVRTLFDKDLARKSRLSPSQKYLKIFGQV